jgi:hypothetical protein
MTHSPAKFGVTGPDWGECTAVAHAWEQNLGLPIVYGNAEDIYANADSNLYLKVRNGPTNVPQPGDIMVWGGSTASDTMTTEGIGHVGIFDNGDSNGFISFDQNFPTGHAPGMIHHSYNGVIGWLHPKTSINQEGNDMIPDENHLQVLFQAFRGRAAAPDEVKQYVGASYSGVIEALNAGSERDATNQALAEGKIAIRDQWGQQIYGLQAALKTANDNLAALQSQVATLGARPTQAQLDALTASVADATKKATDAQTALSAATAQQAAAQATGNSFLQWLGQQLNKLLGR